MMMITNFSCLALYERITRGITILCQGLVYTRRAALAARKYLSSAPFSFFLSLSLFLVGGQIGALCILIDELRDRKAIMVCILCEKAEST
jgi:hypothetical protein